MALDPSIALQYKPAEIDAGSAILMGQKANLNQIAIVNQQRQQAAQMLIGANSKDLLTADPNNPNAQIMDHGKLNALLQSHGLGDMTPLIAKDWDNASQQSMATAKNSTELSNVRNEAYRTSATITAQQMDKMRANGASEAQLMDYYRNARQIVFTRLGGDGSQFYPDLEDGADTKKWTAPTIESSFTPLEHENLKLQQQQQVLAQKQFAVGVAKDSAGAQMQDAELQRQNSLYQPGLGAWDKMNLGDSQFKNWTIQQFDTKFGSDPASTAFKAAWQTYNAQHPDHPLQLGDPASRTLIENEIKKNATQHAAYVNVISNQQGLGSTPHVADIKTPKQQPIAEVPEGGGTTNPISVNSPEEVKSNVKIGQFYKTPDGQVRQRKK